MRVLITGGYGVFAYHLCKHLRDEGHEFAIVDHIDGWEFEEPCALIEPTEYFGDNFKAAIVDFKPTHVVHAAEVTNPDMSMSEHAAYTNVGFATSVLHTCAANGIRCVVPTWYEFSKQGELYNGTWCKSVAWRNQLSEEFNIGNAVIANVALPRIMSPYQNSQTFGAIVKRIYNAANGNTALASHRGEVNKLTELHYCSPEFAVDIIYRILCRRMRGSIRESQYQCSDFELVSYTLKKLEVDSVVISSPPHKNIEYGKIEESFRFAPIAKMIDEAFDVWTR